MFLTVETMRNEARRPRVFLMARLSTRILLFVLPQDAMSRKEFPKKWLCVPRFHWFAFIGRDVGHQIYYCQMKLSEWNSVPGTPHRPISINSEYLFYVSQAGCRNRHFRKAALNMKIYKSESVTERSQQFEMVHGLTPIWSNGVACIVKFLNSLWSRRSRAYCHSC